MITAEQVKHLREKTGVGMMDCKRALEKSGGNMDEAVEVLRKQGLAVAHKRSVRTASEGLICGFAANNGNTVAMVEINCETDFVARTDEFKGLAEGVTKYVALNNPPDMDTLLKASVNGQVVSDWVSSLIAKIGEKIVIKRFIRKEADGKRSRLGHYVHAGSKIGVVVVLDGPMEKIGAEAPKDVAMHIAAMSPKFVRKSDVPESVIKKEHEVYAAALVGEKKPPQVIEKIISGKVDKYLSEVILEQQVFVKDPTGKKTVAQYLISSDKDVKIREFERFEVGE